MRLSHTAPDDRGNADVGSPLPPYRGFRHQVQPRNAELATAIEIFFRLGDFDALVATGGRKSRSEQVMLVAYLVANDFAGVARDCARAWGLDLVDALKLLDRANGRELAEVLGWTEGVTR